MASKQEMIDENRYINVEEDWWAEDVIDDFCYQMMGKGIHVEPEQIKYSGFCSQGDGASFITQDFDFDLFAKKHQLYEGRDWLEAAVNAGVEVTIKMDGHRYHHVHENNVYAEVITESTAHDALPHDVDESDIRYAAATVIQDAFDLNMDSELDTEITETLRGYMKKLYRSLESLYYDLIEDEAVWDTLEANCPDYIAEELDDDEDSEDEED
jgi:hypothetical protein